MTLDNSNINYSINPFKILNVNRDDNKRDIICKVTIAMREKKVDLKVIAEAQKMLFNPLQRKIAEFIHVLDFNEIISQKKVLYQMV